MLNILSNMYANNIQVNMEGRQDVILTELLMGVETVLERLAKQRTQKNVPDEQAIAQLIETFHSCMISSYKIKYGSKTQLAQPEQPKMIAKEKTANDVVKEATGLDMEQVQLEQLMVHELIDKWLPVIDDHILTDKESTELLNDITSSGLEADMFFDMLIDKKLENNKEVK